MALGERVDEHKGESQVEAVAIVGLSGRYPQSRDLAAFWDNLRGGRDCITEVPAARWNWRDYYSDDRTQGGRHFSKWGGFIEGVEEFDPLFFNIAPRDATYIDPQERLFLQHAWMAMEDAGYTRGTLGLRPNGTASRQVGVYAGVMYSEYQLLAAAAGRRQELRMGFSGLIASVANRVSYALNLNGPSMTVDTMCSSSLSAIHLACQDLRVGRTDVGLAGGVNVSIHPNKYFLLSAGQFISSAGQCQSFGEGGDGYIPGEGVGVVVLKRLADARRDGDHIYGLIRGSALSHGGKTHGYTVPNPHAQSEAIGRAMREARIEPRQVSYVEAHGTGTKLGDPIEIAGLGAVFGGVENTGGKCAIGSVKSNIGHCESAAGIAGLTKVLLQMRHGLLVPSLHARQLNPHIDFERSTFEVNQHLTEWRRPVLDGRERPRIAGISSFGAGGSNAHLVIEEYRDEGRPWQRAPDTAQSVAIVLSARTVRQLHDQAEQLLRHVSGDALKPAEIDLRSLAYTLQVGREALAERAGFVVTTVRQLRDGLQGLVDREATPRAEVGKHPGNSSPFDEDPELRHGVQQWLAQGELGKVVDLWVKGFDVDWLASYGARRPQRMSLPTYPFSRERYWIDTSEAERATDAAHAPPSAPARAHAPTSAISRTDLTPETVIPLRRTTARTAVSPARREPASAKPTRVRLTALGEPGAATPTWAAARPLARVRLSTPARFDATSWVANATDPSAFLRVHREAGIMSIHIDDAGGGNTLSATMIDHLVQAIELFRDTPGGKVLMIRGGNAWFAQGGREAVDRAAARGLYRAVATFPHPVIMVAAGAAQGAGFLLAALGDFLVCGEESTYCYTDAPNGLVPTAAETEFFRSRLGTPQAAHFLRHGGAMRGATLREDKWSCAILPAAAVARHAAELANALASRSPDTLALLKRHLSLQLVQQVAALTPAAAGASSIEPSTTAGPKAGPALAPGRALAAWDTCVEVRLTGRVGVLTVRAEARTLTATAVIDALHEAVRAAGTLGCKALVLRSELADFLPPAQAADAEPRVAELTYTLSQAAMPIVAALEHGAGGIAWLVAQSCDGCMHSTEGDYSLAELRTRPGLRREAAAVFAERLGAVGREILFTQSTYTGRELRDRLGCLSVVERGEVFTGAVTMAEHWAELPSGESLSSRARAAAATAASAAAAAGPWASAGARHAEAPASDAEPMAADAPASVQAPVRISLLTEVVSASMHPGGVVVIEMRDVETKNMFSDALMQGLEEAFAHVARSEEYKVVVLTGYDTYFASGGTKESLLAIQQGRAKFTDFRVFELPLTCALPVIAAMQGHGIGAGWVLGMFADVVLFSDESRYVSPYVGYGFTPGAGSTLVLPHSLGHDLSRETLLTAREFTGRELAARGMPMRVLPRADVVPWALALARRIAANPRGSLRELKAHFSKDLRARLEDTYARELAMHEASFVGQDGTRTLIEDTFRAVNRWSGKTPATTAGGQPTGAVSGTLRKLLAQELQLRDEDIGDNVQFVDLGLDSISGVTWIRKINEHYGTAIEAIMVYSYPTLAQLSRHVQDEAAKQGSLSVEETVEADDASAPMLDERAAAAPSTAALSARLPAETPIAVIGMAGQFPAARSVQELWQNIVAGKHCVTEIPASRWNHAEHYSAGRPVAGKSNSKWMGALDDHDLFDPLFFNISPTEAQSMDPQQRLFLQACWHAIEDAGIEAKSLAGARCGVFVGCTHSDYRELAGMDPLSAQGFLGGANSILAGRVSYFLNLQGPSVAIDTACSSSLVALAQACESLQCGSSDMALAGGVYVMASPEMHIKTAQAGMLSPDGRCYTFDQRANGFVPGEAVGVVVLKRLADAERDGDNILATLRGWGVNQDGKTNGITAPNPQSQSRLQRDVYDRFGIDPRQIQLVEAHGTGTQLGDPIEIQGLKDSFGTYTQESNFCALGSVKSNMGHSLTAAGISGVIKLLLAFKHRTLPPTVNFESLNEHINLLDSPFYVNDRSLPWEPQGPHPRLAAISSFGFSGTNAHVVLAAHPAAPPRKSRVTTEDGRHALLLSAKTTDALERRVADLVGFIDRADTELDLMELAYTLQTGREAMEERLAVMAGSLQELLERLRAHAVGEPATGVYRGRAGLPHPRVSLINEDAGVKSTLLAKWIAGGQIAKLAELWVHGLGVHWRALYGDRAPRKVSAPLYPFARERYWVDEAPAHNGAGGRASQRVHPLLTANTSTLRHQSHECTFTGQEFFLSDHRLSTRQSPASRVLPGVVYLEMARAAVEHRAAPMTTAGVLVLRDTVWLVPLVVAPDRPHTLTLQLEPGAEPGDDSVSYQMSCVQGGEDIFHCRGSAVFLRIERPTRLDLAGLGLRMHAARFTAAQVYATFDAMGLLYGPAHRVITSLRLGSGELLADLRLPECIAGTAGDYGLHPAMLDGALQATIGLICDLGSPPDVPYVPFSLKSVIVYATCGAHAHAWIRPSPGVAASSNPRTLDIDVCDAQGTVCLQLKGFAYRVLKTIGPPEPRAREPVFDEQVYESIIARLMNGELSPDEAADLG